MKPGQEPGQAVLDWGDYVDWLAADRGTLAARNLSTTLRHSSAPFSEPLVRSCPASLRAG